jgi:hypothetical protein
MNTVSFFDIINENEKNWLEYVKFKRDLKNKY